MMKGKIDMENFEFAIIASGASLEDDEFLNRLFESGCDDATLSFQKGVIIAEFDREAQSFANAIIDGCAQIHNAGAKIERIEPDHLVSLSEISERCELSKAAISLYINGKRQEGFPCPSAKVTSKHPLWDWYEVASWLNKNGYLDEETVYQAKIVRDTNIIISQSDAKDINIIDRLSVLQAA